MTDNIGIVIQCRDGSTRHKEKSVRPFYGEKSILEILIERFKHLPYKTVVATEPKSFKTKEICRKTKTECVAGSEEDVLARIYETACVFDFDGIFRVCADNPFIQLPLLYPIKKWVENAYFDYVSFKGSMKRHEGFFVEYVSRRALGDVYRFCPLKYEREHVTPYIINHPERYKHKILPIPPELDFYHLRLTVDTKEDFRIARLVYKFVKDKWWSHVLDWCIYQPEVYLKMQENIKRNPK